MNTNKTARIVRSLCLLALILLPLSGCATGQDPWGDPDSGLIMTYRMPEEGALKYAMTFDQQHTLSVRGEKRRFGNGRTIDFSAAPAESTDGNLRLTVTIDAMNLTMDTPRGENNLEVKKVQEQSFELTLSPLGQVLDTGEAEELTYFLGGAGEQGIDNDFRDLFPGLPDEAVRVGDSWTHEGSIPGKSFNPETSIHMASVNTLEGFETIDGMECAKIASTIEGELVTEGDSAARAAISGGPVTGSAVWYFAYKEGLLVKASRTVRATTEIVLGEPGSPPVPAVEETTIEIGLVREVAG